MVGGHKSWPLEPIKSSPIAKLDKVLSLVRHETTCLVCCMPRDLDLSRTLGGMLALEVPMP